MRSIYSLGDKPVKFKREYNGSVCVYVCIETFDLTFKNFGVSS